MKTVTKLTLLTFTAVAMNSCGGGSCPATTQVLAINTLCNATDDTTAYTPLQSGDIISKEEEDTIIHILHDQDNQKFACIASGKASIIRGV